MKNCDEMVNSLLERRDRYEAEKKRKRSVMIRAAAPVCCVCLIALLGVGSWIGGAFNKAEPKQTPEIPEQTSEVTENGVVSETEQDEKTEPVEQNTTIVEEVKYITMGASGDWPVYKNVKELTDAGNVILSGKITDVSFDFTNPYLYSIYRIEVDTFYKGDAAGTLDLRVMGGIEGAFIEEQKTALGDRADEGIPLTEERPVLEIGQTYLFVLNEYETGKATLVNWDQSAFNVADPLAKDTFDFVSAKDIISFFGEDK